MNTGQEPGAAAPRATSANALTNKLNSLFSSTYRNDLATVFSRSAAGEFEDASLTLAEQAAMTKLELARRGGGGADAAPESTPVTGGGAAPTGGAPTDTSAVAAERELYAVRVAQSEARLSKLSSQLRAENPEAAALQSASSGSWDPATYKPKSAVQVKAFAQRMVIDSTEGAARLEIVKNQLDAARLEATANPSATATALVTKLEADFARQQEYVVKLVTIVDDASNGRVSKVGADVQAGSTVRGASDLTAGELAKELRAKGRTEEEIVAIVGAQELAVDEAVTPGGSTVLKEVVDSTITSMMLKFQRRRDEARREDFQKQQEQRKLDAHYEERHAERRSTQEQAQQRAMERHDTAKALNDQAASRLANARTEALNAYMRSRAS